MFARDRFITNQKVGKPVKGYRGIFHGVPAKIPTGIAHGEIALIRGCLGLHFCPFGQFDVQIDLIGLIGVTDRDMDTIHAERARSGIAAQAQRDVIIGQCCGTIGCERGIRQGC